MNKWWRRQQDGMIKLLALKSIDLEDNIKGHSVFPFIKNRTEKGIY